MKSGLVLAALVLVLGLGSAGVAVRWVSRRGAVRVGPRLLVALGLRQQHRQLLRAG